MRKLLMVLILFTVISCSKDKLDKDAILPSTSTESLSIVKKNVDSLARMNAGAFMESNLTEREKDSISTVANESISSISVITGEGSEYTDWSGKIHLKRFWRTTENPTHHPTIEVPVPDDWVVVGGGAEAFGWQNAGGFLTESRPNTTLTSWIAKSKDHAIADPHYLTAYAIGMKIDSVTPAYLRSKIHLTIRTSSQANHPNTFVSVPENCLLIGGGALVNWFNYGNLLTASYPDGNTWYVSSKDHYRPEPCTITAFAIGIEDISFPYVGYLQIDHTLQDEAVFHGEGLVSTESLDTYALTCGGGQAFWWEYGRMLTKNWPQLNTDIYAYTLDLICWDPGNTWAHALMIRVAR